MYCGEIPQLSQSEKISIDRYLRKRLTENNKIILLNELFNLVHDTSFIKEHIKNHKISQYFNQNPQYQIIHIIDEIKIVTSKETAYVVQGSISYDMKTLLVRMSRERDRL